MEAASAARGRRVKNLSLRAAPKARRRKESLDAAFESFYRNHVAEVYQYALAVLGNSTDAEDVTQQTFLNAYRAFQRGEQPRKPHNWLIKIAHNVCRMRWRQSGRRPQEVPLESAGEPVARDDERQSLDEVLSALARLPLNQRAAIVMREIEDRSYAEIAEILGTTVPAVEALLFRARGNLRERRNALAGALAIAPVPGSLASFSAGGSGGLAAAGGALLGSELAAKAAAVVAAGVVVGGLGFKAVDVVAPSDPQTVRSAGSYERTRLPAQISLLGPSSGTGSRVADIAGFRHLRSAVSGQGALRTVPTNDLPSESGSSGSSPSASAPEAPVSSSSAPALAAPVSAPVSTVISTTNPVTQLVPSVPTVTAIPSTTLTASTPVVSVTATVPTVTVTVPTVELPPPLK
jgi:RNA polymerase sigma-70 factor, ECF subfamily